MLGLPRVNAALVASRRRFQSPEQADTDEKPHQRWGVEPNAARNA
jgi:hypothetical protein